MRKREYLLSCEALIQASQHSFLTHDSFIDCRDAFPFDLQELTNGRGSLSADAKQSVLKAVAACPVLQKKHKQLILPT